MLPSIAVAVPGRRLAQPIPTMERRDRNSLGRLVMPVADISGSAVAFRSATDAQVGHSRSNADAPGGTQGSKDIPGMRQPAADSGAAVSRSAASKGSSQAGLGVRPVILKRTSSSREAQLALKRRRMDHNVRLVLSEPVRAK